MAQGGKGGSAVVPQAAALEVQGEGSEGRALPQAGEAPRRVLRQRQVGQRAGRGQAGPGGVGAAQPG